MVFKQISATATGILPAGAIIVGLRLVAGANAATVNFYDSATATGTGYFCRLSADAANGVDAEYFPENSGQMLSTGLVAFVTGTSPDCFIYYV